MLGRVSRQQLLKSPPSKTTPTVEERYLAIPGYGRLQSIILVHTLIAARWVVLPLYVFLATDSILVAWQITGHFAAWSLTVLLANTSLSAYVAARGNAAIKHWRRQHQVLLALPVVVIPVLIGCVLIVAPAVGKALTAAVALLAVLFIAVATCAHQTGRWRAISGLYTVWSLFESLFGMIAGSALLFFGKLLLTDGRGGVLKEWTSLFQVFLSMCIVSYISFAIQVYLLCLLWQYEGRADEAEAAIAATSTYSEQHVESEENPADATDDDVSEQSEVADAAAVESRHRGAALLAFCLCPAYVFVLLFFTAGFLICQVWVPGELVTKNTPTPPCSGCYCVTNSTHEFSVEKDVPFGEAYNRERRESMELTLDIYRPQGQGFLESGLAPAIIFAHGGGFIYGSKGSSIVVPEARYFAGLGFVAFSVNYRLEADVAIPELYSVRDAVYDLKAAIRYVVRHAEELGVDAHRIAVWGSSAGAITAVSSMLEPNDGDSGNEGFPSNITAAVGVSGCLWPFLLRPFHGADQRDQLVPWMDIHGDSDITVFPTLAIITHHLLRDYGVPDASNRLVWVRHGGHVPWVRWFGPNHAHSGEPPDGEMRTRDILRPHVQAFLVNALGLQDASCSDGSASEKLVPIVQ